MIIPYRAIRENFLEEVVSVLAIGKLRITGKQTDQACEGIFIQGLSLPGGEPRPRRDT